MLTGKILAGTLETVRTPAWLRQTCSVMDEREENTRLALLAVVKDLEDMARRLTALHDTVPASPQEASLVDLGADPDMATTLRAVIAAVLADSLRPAIDHLRAAAA